MCHHDYFDKDNVRQCSADAHIFVLGFVFSEDEQTALKQFEGGPCAVIAPVQVLFTSTDFVQRPHSHLNYDCSYLYRSILNC